MGTLIMIGQIFLALGILITIHELGHFLAARLFKIRVDKFYLFFDFLFPMPNVLNFAIFKKKIGATEYGLGWFPMGGYVQIAGMVDESTDKEDLGKDPEPDEYRAKPAWQRLIVLMGGIIFNIILGIIIFTGIKAYWGDSYLPASAVNAKHGIYASPEMEELGFKTGDKIVALNSREMKRYEELFKTDFLLSDTKEITALRDGKQVKFDPGAEYGNTLAGNKNKPMLLVIDHALIDSLLPGGPAYSSSLKKGDRLLQVNGEDAFTGRLFSYHIKQNKNNEVTIAVLRNKDTIRSTMKVSEEGTIGISMKPFTFDESDIVRETYSFGQSIGKGVTASFNALAGSVKGFGAIFSGKLDATKSLSGPVGIARMFGDQWNWQRFWNLTGLLSMALAFFNVLPIPGLDGGHATFVLYEMVTGRMPNEKFQYAMQAIGMVIILTLMVLIFGLDIYNAILGN